jgi:CBS domain-containing protein
MTTVKELMTPHPHLISPISSLQKAAEHMKEFDCGALVVGAAEHPEGVLTDRDIVIWGLAEDKDPWHTEIKEIMTTEVITCYEDDEIEVAADHMSVNDVRRIVVLNKEDKVVGVLSVVDIIKCADRDAVNDDVLHHLFKYA